jgi:hypothetical protein
MAKKKQSAGAAEQQLLRDIQKLTGLQFVDDSRWGGFVPAGDALSEQQTGPPVPFADLHWQHKANVLRDFISWGHYLQNGIDWHDHATIEYNVVRGKPRDRWLEGTSLRQSFRLVADGRTPTPPKQYPEITQKDLANIRDALGVAGADGPGPKAEDGKLSLQELRNESQEQVRRGEGERSKPREIER